MKNDEWLDQFIAYLRIERGLSVNTLASYRHDLTLYFEHLGRTAVVQARPADVSEFLRFLYGRAFEAAVRGARPCRSSRSVPVSSS